MTVQDAVARMTKWSILTGLVIAVVIEPVGRSETLLAQTKVPEPLAAAISNLATLSRELKLQGQFDYGEVADIMSFAYGSGLRRSGAKVGQWSSEIKDETVLSTYLLCPEISYKNLPKERPGYRDSMRKVRAYLYRGSFDRMVSQFAVRDKFWGLKYGQFPKKLDEVLAEPTEFVDFPLLGEVENLRAKFK